MMINTGPGKRSDLSIRAALSDEYKRRAQEQWSANPCGAHVARGHTFGTRQYFDAIEEYRYRVYSPWMREAIGFDRYRGKRLLEIGCGTGTDLLQFARGGALVTGVDLTPRSVEIARRRFEVYDQRGEFALEDAEMLSFADESFDVVYSFGVLHHTPDTGRAIREVHRVLRHGGEAIVMLYNRASLYYWGAIVLKHGIFRGELFSSGVEEIMSRHVEQSETGGAPLVKAYTKREAREFFKDFARTEISVNQLTREELRLAGRLLPERIFVWLANHFGWNLIIRAIK
ncbi:MAG TPA: class I SAM-dependent methyltransferase [Blastocatellia bacterium]|nr:class I SAM-dependent methyltransferase [Blastocatellia bacterium]